MVLGVVYYWTEEADNSVHSVEGTLVLLDQARKVFEIFLSIVQDSAQNKKKNLDINYY